MSGPRLTAGDLLSHHEMCAVEGKMLQQGMNFAVSKGHSVILMSQRPGAPYPDRLSEDRSSLLYVGHDAYGHPDKTHIDQPLSTPVGSLTQNGRFFLAAEEGRQGTSFHRVNVYEKLKPGIWVFNGQFELRDAKRVVSEGRQICVFELTLSSEEWMSDDHVDRPASSPGRLIPTEVKLAVYKRDSGRCVLCGSTRDLHFDHILPYSKGGASDTVENIQLLCREHNLQKRDNIE